MTLTMIHGFLHEKQACKPEFGNIIISEVVLVETSTPVDNIIDLIAMLPAYPASPSATNPKGISFTLQESPHPDAAGAILYEAGEIRQAEGGGTFWHIPLSYKTDFSQDLASNSNNPRKRKDQRVKNPLSRPIVWNTSSQEVQKQTFTKPDGTVITHTNGLPITEPITVTETHKTHTFSFNIAYSSYNDSDYTPYLGMVSSATVFGMTAQNVKLSGMTANEEYEDVDTAGDGSSYVTYHYVRVTLTFEINPSGWVDDAVIYSMSTVQKEAGGAGTVPITINDRGDYATAPWPLQSNGFQCIYDPLNPADFGELDTGYPQTANLATLVSALGLTIP